MFRLGFPTSCLCRHVGGAHGVKPKNIIARYHENLLDFCGAGEDNGGSCVALNEILTDSDRLVVCLPQLSLVCKPSVDSITPNFTPIGAACRPCGAKNLKIAPPPTKLNTGRTDRHGTTAYSALAYRRAVMKKCSSACINNIAIGDTRSSCRNSFHLAFRLSSSVHHLTPPSSITG